MRIKKITKTAALILAVVMIVSAVPINIFAGEVLNDEIYPPFN